MNLLLCYWYTFLLPQFNVSKEKWHKNSSLGHLDMYGKWTNNKQAMLNDGEIQYII